MEIGQIIHIVAEILLILGLVIFLYFQIRKQDVLIENLNKKLEENSTLMKKHDNVIGKMVEIMTLKVQPLPPQMGTHEDLRFQPQINTQVNTQPGQQQIPKPPPSHVPQQIVNSGVEEIGNDFEIRLEPNTRLPKIEEEVEEEDDENIDAEIEEELKDLE